jgi:transcriptional regulator with XRE-family HTH domain
MEDENEQLQYVIRRIKEIRKQKSMSQLELSVESNLSLSFLASVEKGKKQPSVLTLLRIASALDVNPKIFFPETVNGSKEETKNAIIDLVRSL